MEETKLCSWCMADVLCPETWASGSQPLLGSVEPSREGTQVSPLCKSAEMHARSTCGGQKRDFLDESIGYNSLSIFCVILNA